MMLGASNTFNKMLCIPIEIIILIILAPNCSQGLIDLSEKYKGILTAWGQCNARKTLCYGLCAHRYRTTNQICACAEWDRKYSAILKLRKRHTNQWRVWLAEVDFFIFLSYYWVDFNQIKSNIFLKNYTFYVYTNDEF